MNYRAAMARGTVYRNKQTGTWNFVVDVAGPGQPRRQIDRGGFATRKQAEAVLEQVRSEHRQVRSLDASVTTWRYLDEWLTRRALDGLKPSTIDSYRRSLTLYVSQSEIADTPLASLQARHLNDLYARLLTSGRRGRRSPRTVRLLHTIVRKALKDATRAGLIPTNPADNASPPTSSAAAPPEMECWSAEQLAEFLDQHRKHHLYPLIHLAAYTGLRRGELAALRWNDVDLDHGVLTVRHSLTWLRPNTADERPWELTAPKTRQGRRRIDLDADTIEVLRRLRGSQGLWKRQVGSGYAPDGFVFASEHGKPYRPDSLTQAFARLVARSGIDPISFHGLRHTHATLLLAQGQPVKVVSERLGHASIQITLNTYAHVMPGQQAEAATAFATHLATKRTPPTIKRRRRRRRPPPDATPPPR
jgi:integrase